MDRSELAIIIPAYNESKTIERVVASVLPYGIPIVVNDCSSDDTAKIAELAGAFVVNHTINQGYDAALNSGFLEADKRDFLFAITFDADGQHGAEKIEKFLSYLKNGCDLVLGVRPNYARFSEMIFAYYTKIRFGILDPLCGMKGYNMNLYRMLGYFDSYQSIGTELAFYAVKNKKSFAQVAIPVSARVGKSRFGQCIRANLKILRAILLS